MATIKELKRDNKNALRYLHNGFGLDFQQPIIVIKQNGKFIAKTIVDRVSKEIDNFSPEDYEIVLLIRHYDYAGQLEKQHAVAFGGERFEDRRSERLQGRYRYILQQRRFRTYPQKQDRISFRHSAKERISYRQAVGVSRFNGQIQIYPDFV